jgi:hypothetical protein
MPSGLQSDIPAPCDGSLATTSRFQRFQESSGGLARVATTGRNQG